MIDEVDEVGMFSNGRGLISDVRATMDDTRVYDRGQSIGGSSASRVEIVRSLYPSVARPTSFSSQLRSSYTRIIVENPPTTLPPLPPLPPLPSNVSMAGDAGHSSASLNLSSAASSRSSSMSGSSDFAERLEHSEGPSAVIDDNYDQLANFNHIANDQLEVVDRLARGHFGEVHHSYLFDLSLFRVKIHRLFFLLSMRCYCYLFHKLLHPDINDFAINLWLRPCHFLVKD